MEHSTATTGGEIKPHKRTNTCLINRTRADSNNLNLQHFKNIGCKDNNNKYCLVPIYQTPDNLEELEQAEHSVLLATTIH